MWFCEDCGAFFDESEIATEREYHSELAGMGGKTYEEYGVCPKCRSEDIEECEVCEICGNPVKETTYIADKDMCEECAEKLRRIINEAKDKIVGELDIDALVAEELIDNFYY